MPAARRPISILAAWWWGAIWGAAVWSTYGTLEFLLYSFVPLCTRPLAVFTPLTWQATALIFACYWLIGALAGGLLGSLAALAMRGRDWPEGSAGPFRLAASFGLLAGVIITHVLAYPLGRSATVTLAMVVILSGATVWALLHPAAPAAKRIQMNPQILAILILGPSWLSADLLESAGIVWKGIAILLLISAGIGLNLLMTRRRDWSAARHLTASLAALAAMAAVCVIVSGARGKMPVPPQHMAGPATSAPVVLVTLDTTRADHLSLYGYRRNTTPNLTEFARTSTVFTEAAAASDMTLPSHASLFTGLYPSRHGAHSYHSDSAFARSLDKTFPTLAGILAAHGYFTAAAVGNSAYLVPRWGLARDFQVFSVLSPVAVLPYDRWYIMRHAVRRALDHLMDTGWFDVLYRRGEEINRDAGRIMQRSAWKRPFLLFVNYMDAHAPYVPPRPFNSMFQHREEAVDYRQQRTVERNLLERKRSVPERVRASLIAQYDAAIAYEDYAFGGLVRMLKSRGVYDDALIIVAGDHGEAFGERGRMEHGNSVYEDEVHVPLIVKYPRQKDPSVVHAAVSHVDVLPTVLDVVGLPIPGHVQGRTLRDVAALAGRDIVSESFPNVFTQRCCPEFDRTERAVRRGHLKLIVSTNGKRELFDLASDPGEMRNLAGDNAAVKELQAALVPLVGADHEEDRRAPEVTDRRELNRLKSLGYVQ